jgi:hypothetical protein
VFFLSAEALSLLAVSLSNPSNGAKADVILRGYIGF